LDLSIVTSILDDDAALVGAAAWIAAVDP